MFVLLIKYSWTSQGQWSKEYVNTFPVIKMETTLYISFNSLVNEMWLLTYFILIYNYVFYVYKSHNIRLYVVKYIEDLLINLYIESNNYQIHLLEVDVRKT